MELKNILSEDFCCILNNRHKTEALFTLMDIICLKSTQKIDQEKLHKEIFYREELMSTGLGFGIGIPHVRFEGVSDPIIAVGIQPDGIADYDSIDSEDIKIVIMIIVGKDQHRDHLRLLSLVMSQLKKDETKTRLLTAASGKEIHSILLGD